MNEVNKYDFEEGQEAEFCEEFKVSHPTLYTHCKDHGYHEKESEATIGFYFSVYVDIMQRDERISMEFAQDITL